MNSQTRQRMSRAGLLLGATVLYLVLLKTARFGPWFDLRPPTPEEFRVWQIAILLVTVVIMPGALGILLVSWLLEARRKRIGWADCATWLFGLLLFRWWISEGRIWLQESLAGLSQHQVNAFSDALRTGVWLTPACAVAAGVFCLWAHLKRKDGRSRG